MSAQLRNDDSMSAAESPDHGTPERGVTGHAVEQHERERAVAMLLDGDWPGGPRDGLHGGAVAAQASAPGGSAAPKWLCNTPPWGSPGVTTNMTE